MFRRKTPSGPLKPEDAAPTDSTRPETMATEQPMRSPFADKGSDMSLTKPPSASPFKPEIPRRVVEIPGAPPRRSDTPVAGGSPMGGSLPSGGATDMRKLIVGRDISLAGEISACDVLVVEGTVEAKLRDGRNIEIAETGLFKGSVEIDEADIAGRFEGDISVRGRLRLRATGRITGTIRYGQLEVEAGGQLIGEIQSLSNGGPTLARNPGSEAAPAPSPSPIGMAGSGE